MHYQKRASRSRKITDRFKTSHNTSEIQPLEPRRLFTVFYVNSVTDNISAVDHVISLREAMTAAATNSPCGNAPAGSPGLDTIRFNIPGSGLKTIQPASALPTIAMDEPVYIDGFTQPGSLANTSASAQNAVMRIQINGTLAGSNTHGFTIEAMHTTIRGLVINGFSKDGIHIATRTFDFEQPDNSGTATIVGNFIGTNATGTVAVPNGGNGVTIEDFVNNPGASGHTIGRPALADRNLISGNAGDGINIAFNSGSNNIENNLIGTNAAGSAAIGNGLSGIVTNTKTTIVKNVISGNVGGGIVLGEQGNSLVTGNFVGLNAGGTFAVPNGGIGIYVSGLSDQLTIGGTTASLRNLISGNGNSGIFIDGSISGGSRTKVVGNFIGVNRSGSSAVPNGGYGIEMYVNFRTQIGGSVAGERNVISGNVRGGVYLVESWECKVVGNYIGTNATGSAALGNGGSGVTLGYGSHHNDIGGASPARGNVIAASSRYGIHLLTEADSFGITQANQVQNNFVGTNTSATLNLGNALAGVFIENSLNNTIGGAAGSGNCIRFNRKGVVVAAGDWSMGNSVTYNAVWSNQLIQIDLGHDGSTPNDVGDVDTGPNGFQNTAILRTPHPNSMAGDLYSTPSATFTVQFYQSSSTGAGGLGELEMLVGTLTVTTNSSGHASFSMTPAVPLIAGRYLTAIVTSLEGTSEVSAPILIEP